MRYKCQFPDCDFETDNRSQINEHHLIPKELAGPNFKWNMILLCPNHHARVYIPDAIDGIHSIKCENSIILHGWHNWGMLLEYEDMAGNIVFSERR